MCVDLQVRYEQKIEQTLQKLARKRFYSLRWILRIFPGMETPAPWFSMAWAAVGVAGCAGLAFFTNMSTEHKTGAILALGLVVVFGYRPFFRSAMLAFPFPADLQAVKELTAAIEGEPRIQALLVQALKQEGTDVLTCAQVERFSAAAQRIATWRNLEAMRAGGLRELDRLNLVTQARTEQRAETIGSQLPDASMTTRQPRF